MVERAVVAAAEAAAEEAAAELAAAEATYARLIRLELEVDGAGGEGMRVSSTDRPRTMGRRGLEAA